MRALSDRAQRDDSLKSPETESQFTVLYCSSSRKRHSQHTVHFYPPTAVRTSCPALPQLSVLPLRIPRNWWWVTAIITESYIISRGLVLIGRVSELWRYHNYWISVCFCLSTNRKKNDTVFISCQTRNIPKRTFSCLVQTLIKFDSRECFSLGKCLAVSRYLLQMPSRSFRTSGLLSSHFCMSFCM